MPRKEKTCAADIAVRCCGVDGRELQEIPEIDPALIPARAFDAACAVFDRRVKSWLAEKRRQAAASKRKEVRTCRSANVPTAEPTSTSAKTATAKKGTAPAR